MMLLQRYASPIYLFALCGESVVRPTRGFTSLRSTARKRRHHQRSTTVTSNYLSPKDDNSSGNNNSNHNKQEELVKVDQNDGSMLDNLVSFYQDRWEAADVVEIRLDATIVACHTLARFLAYDTSLPAKSVPGMELTDVIMVLDTFSSAVVLVFLWTAAGLVVRLFEDPSNGTRLVTTTLLAAPLWLLLERSLSWPTSGASDDILGQVVLGSLGLLATMSFSRLVPKLLR
eukprot:scaffold175_cov177-Amphora_coffeaeformis.AAC.23